MSNAYTHISQLQGIGEELLIDASGEVLAWFHDGNFVTVKPIENLETTLTLL